MQKMLLLLSVFCTVWSLLEACLIIRFDDCIVPWHREGLQATLLLWIMWWADWLCHVNQSSHWIPLEEDKAFVLQHLSKKIHEAMGSSEANFQSFKLSVLKGIFVSKNSAQLNNVWNKRQCNTAK